VGYFLRSVAKQHGRDTAPLWELLESQPDEFTSSAWESSLGQVGYFLSVAKQHGRDTAPLWELLESQPDKLAASAWASSLHDVGSFLNVAKQHGRDTAPLWELLEREPDKLAASLSKASLDQVGVFFKFAQMHGWPEAKLENIFNANLHLLCSKGHEAAVHQLAIFGRYAPDALLEAALLGIKPGHWKTVPITQRIVGGTSLTMNFGRINRIDLKDDLLTLLLQRSNWRDFHPRFGGFAQVCWLLANVPDTASEFVEPFLKAVCTEKWLQTAYITTGCDLLAAGLRQLALNQTVERCRQFHHRSLSSRLNYELEHFVESTPSEQLQAVQFLGCYVLCGGAVSRRRLSGIDQSSLSLLLLGMPTYSPEMTRIDDLHMQLWLGLRAFASIKREWLSVPSETIKRTLKLWRANLEDSAETPSTTKHQVNQSMVNWLEVCSRITNPSALLPTKEPLWTLAGFPTRFKRSW
jgi:hypothetical protein